VQGGCEQTHGWAASVLGVGANREFSTDSDAGGRGVYARCEGGGRGPLKGAGSICALLGRGGGCGGVQVGIGKPGGRNLAGSGDPKSAGRVKGRHLGGDER